MRSLNPIAQAIERVIELTYCYEIWRALTNIENKDRFGSVCETYDDFFFTIIRSLETSVVVIAYQLLGDRRNDVVSIRSLRESLPDGYCELSERIKSNIDARKDLISRVTSLRHNVYAHRNRDLTPQEVYEKAKITPNEYQSIVELAQKCVASLAEAFGERQEGVFLQELELSSASANKELANLMLTLSRGK